MSVVTHSPLTPATVRRDNRRPVAYETTGSETDLVVTGRLPAELDGCLVRIGPNPTRPDPRAHPLVGDGMVHGVRLRHGRALWYRNRWVRSDSVARTRGELPIPGPRHGLSDNANANVIRHAGRTLALGEAGVLPIELDGELDSVARTDFDATLPHGFTAHAETDPVTGELFAVAYYHDLPYVEHLVVGVDGRVQRSTRIEVVGTPLMHSVALTDRHTVLFDLPVAFDPALAHAGSRFPYAWSAGRPARIGLLPRAAAGPDVRWFEVDPCYVFHPVNAYETADRCVIDVVRHERVFDRDRRAPGECAPTLWRWTLDLTSGSVTAEQLDDIPQEFPRIDDRRKTTPYRYAYTVAMQDGAGALGGSALLRHDLDRRDVAVHDFGPHREAGEAVFVPRGPVGAEDDGWLLTFVYDGRVDRSSLVVLDAADFTGEPVAVVHLPVRVPSGFHANWLAG
ncbi:carotenoid oxygenase family protein [Solwaraspora sp. WMMD792]|uniref:carotenoid oxygenase family protein n=1 Tax=Solwaraspora sp. WMMD792 TaxID=3016099 RepID=UPI002416F527|nr:carotenoid oxygenase family protein [Solwaraspora sp. WMMD792]MDG4774995.1 carotenoid oxygenase family protein [Solwaraspora sp. WMMD792]